VSLRLRGSASRTRSQNAGHASFDAEAPSRREKGALSLRPCGSASRTRSQNAGHTSLDAEAPSRPRKKRHCRCVCAALRQGPGSGTRGTRLSTQRRRAAEEIGQVSLRLRGSASKESDRLPTSRVSTQRRRGAESIENIFSAPLRLCVKRTAIRYSVASFSTQTRRAAEKKRHCLCVKEQIHFVAGAAGAGGGGGVTGIAAPR
jgi:hypothetical protein